jgi:hypothetical protein
MRFIITPTLQWLRKHVSLCRDELLVASPFVGRALLDEVKRMESTANLKLTTRTDLGVFAAKSSDLEAVIGFASCGGEVRSLPGLHAKAYIVDRQVALVTSANATFSGLNRNLECGVELTRPDEVLQLAELVETGFGSSVIPQTWSLKSLESLRGPVSTLRSTMSELSSITKVHEDQMLEIKLTDDCWDKLSEGLPGWAKLTMSVIQSIAEDRFDLQRVYRIGLALAAQRFPRNKNPKEKLRQQLQVLRDMGVIEFLGDGVYKKLFTKGTLSSR